MQTHEYRLTGPRVCGSYRICSRKASGDGYGHSIEKRNRMGDRIKVTDQEKLTLLYERFRDVCLVEKEVWKEIFMPREVTQGPVRTNMQDRYDVEIDDLRLKTPWMRISLAAARPWLPRFRNIERTFRFIEKSKGFSGPQALARHPANIRRQRLRTVMVSGDDLS